MKRIFSLFILTLISFGASYGQATKVFIYDYEKGLFLNEEGMLLDSLATVSARQYQFVKFRVIKVNGLALKLQLNGKGEVINPPQDDVDIANTLTGNLKLEEPEVSDPSDTSSVVTKLLADSETGEDFYNALIELMGETRDNILKLSRISVLENLLEDATRSYFNKKLSLNGITGFTSNSYDEYLVEFSSLMNEIRQGIADLENSMIIGRGKLTADLSAILTAGIKQLKEAYDEDSYTERINKFLNTLRAYSNSQSEFWLDMEVNGFDRLKFETTVEIREKYKDLLALKPNIKPFDVKIFGQRKINASTGVFFTTLIDHSYKTRELDEAGTDGNLEIYREDEGAFKTAGVGALVHFYTTSKTGVQAGMGLGTMVNADGKVRYIAGPSFIFGESNRIVLNFGLAAGSVSRLGGGQVTGTRISDPQGILTKDIFKLGTYLALTYNFSKD